MDDEARELALRWWLKEQRMLADLNQREMAALLGRAQSFVSDCESGQHRVSVIEFLRYCDVLGLEPRNAIRRIAAGKPKPIKLKLKPRSK